MSSRRRITAVCFCCVAFGSILWADLVGRPCFGPGLTTPPPDARLATGERVKTTGLVAAVSRSGNPSEVLGGPLYYCFILLAATLFGWSHSIVALIAICQMAAGDGFADIVGRQFGSVKWPWSKQKSYAGSLGFVVGACCVTLPLIAWFHQAGCIQIGALEAALPVAVISVVCALVELIPWADDNFTVPLAAVILAQLFFGGRLHLR